LLEALRTGRECSKDIAGQAMRLSLQKMRRRESMETMPYKQFVPARTGV
jgi:hypothetical protein